MRILRWILMTGIAGMMLSCGGGRMQFAFSQACVAQSQVTLTGTLRSANGLAAQNDIITLTPSQQGYIAGCGVNLATANTCATSVDGSVVRLPNPLTATIVSIGGGGSLPAGNYWVTYTFYDADGNQTINAPETVQQLSSQGSLTVNAPNSGIPSGAVGMRVYIGTSAGSETLQGSTSSTNSFVQNSPLVAGAALPGANSTLCKVTANDAIWPVGTGYKVSMVDSSSNAIPGYPMQWQLQGPGTTINLSNGLPYYHGVVMYPSPILASPTNHGTQSISGSLDFGGYNVQNVSRLGIGTSLPAYGLDVRSDSNFAGPFNLSGSAGNSGQCLSSTGGGAPVWINCITGVGAIYYQQMQSQSSALPQRAALNWSGRFTLTTQDANTTLVELQTLGNGPKVVAGTTSGTNGHCAQWDASGGIADSGLICSAGSNTDYYFTFTTCTIAQTGNGYACFGTYSGSPFPLANNNYSIQCSPVIPLIAGAFTLNESSLSSSSLPYTWNQIMGNGTSGSAIGATMSCHIHMN